MIPVIARNVLESVQLLGRASRALAVTCIRGITAYEEAMSELVNRSPMVATSLNAVVGYEQAKQFVEESERTGVSVAVLAVRSGLLDEENADRLTDVLRMARPNLDAGRAASV